MRRVGVVKINIVSHNLSYLTHHLGRRRAPRPLVENHFQLKASRLFIKEQSWMPFDFEWQRGYGAFSYSKSQTDAVVKYILNQEEHHRTRTFKEEYVDILTKLEIDFEEKYLFDFYDF